MIYSGCVIIYRINDPNNTRIAAAENAEMLDYTSLSAYVLSQKDASMHYFFFGSPDDNNSQYVQNTVLKTVEKDTGLSLDSIIEPVDISDLIKNMQTNDLASQWGIASYPAFAAVAVQDGQIVVLNKLEWSNDQVLSASAIENWLAENGLYQLPASK